MSRGKVIKAHYNATFQYSVDLMGLLITCNNEPKPSWSLELHQLEN